MAEATELLTWHQIVARLLEPHELLRDVARHQHGVDVGALDQDAVDHVGAGSAQHDRGLGRHQDAGWREGILLADGAHRDGSIRLGRRAEIGLDELAGKVQARGIGRLDPRLRHGRLVDAGKCRKQREDHDDGSRSRSPATFDPCSDIGAVMAFLHRHCSAPRGRNTKR